MQNVMQIEELEAFLQREGSLDALLAAAKAKGGRTAASVTTYKTVDGFSHGPVVTSKEGLGLSALVNAGGHGSYSILAMSGIASGTPFGFEIGSAVMRVEGAEAISHVMEQAPATMVATAQADSHLAFVYAGLSAWEQAVKYAKELAERGATVVVVSCDCDERNKRRLLSEMPFANLVFTDECGGQYSTGRILKEVIERW